MKTADKLAILKLLDKGRPPAFIARATDVPEGMIQALADGLGWPALDHQTIHTEIAGLELEMRGAIPTRQPDTLTSRPAPRAVATTAPRSPVAPVPGGTLNGAPARPAFAVDELVRACARSGHKRTQGLGVKLAELAEKITAALRAERQAAEAKAKRSEELLAAQAEVKRLTQALSAARAKATAAGAPGGARGGPHTCPVCEMELANSQALGAHKRHKHGIASTRYQESPA